MPEHAKAHLHYFNIFREDPRFAGRKGKGKWGKASRQREMVEGGKWAGKGREEWGGRLPKQKFTTTPWQYPIPGLNRTCSILVVETGTRLLIVCHKL